MYRLSPSYFLSSVLALVTTLAIRCPELRAQENWPAYEEYLTVAKMNAAAELQARGKVWSASPELRERYLGLLALATAEIRADHFPEAVSLLDSLRTTVPTSEYAIRGCAQALLSNSFTVLGDPVRGLEEADAGLQELPRNAFLRERLRLMVVRAEAILMQGEDFDAAFDAFLHLAHVADSAASYISHGSAENGMGLVRLNQQRYGEAWEHFRSALRFYHLAGSEMAMQNSVANLSMTAAMNGQYDLALHLCDSLLNELGTRSPEFRAILYDEKCLIYKRTGRYTQALDEINRALALRDTANETFYTAKFPQSAGILYWALGRRDEALGSMAEALRVAERLKWAAQQAEIHHDLHAWYDALGRPSEALRHLQAHTTLTDSLNKTRYSDQLARSETLYGTQKKERRIAEQEQALQFAVIDGHRKSVQRNAFIGAAIALALIAFLLYRSMNARKRLTGQQKLLHDEQVDQLLSQQEIKSINAMLEGQEKERDRVAKDLHDRLGSMLGGIKANMNALEDRVEQMQQDAQYQKVNRLLDQTVSELRQISHDMAAATLSRFGLEKALADLRDTIHINGRLSVELNTFGLDQRLERSVELAIYRIVQELVSNVLKHAKARELSIAVTRSPGRLSLMVSDDGVGFDTTQPAEGIGHANIRSRASALGATVQVDSAPGKGTSVSVECPVVE